MKNIQIYRANKYTTSPYVEVAPNIYHHKNEYVTSLSFSQEPELGEGKFAAEISQYPLEDLLDHFCVHISDFYSTLNANDSTTCYIEFSSRKMERIESLLSVVGKHVYNKDVFENGKTYSVFAIE